MNKIEELKKLKALLEDGAITKDEFNELKKELLKDSSSVSDSEENRSGSDKNRVKNDNRKKTIPKNKTQSKQTKTAANKFDGFQEPNEFTEGLFYIVSGASLLLFVMFWVRYSLVVGVVSAVIAFGISFLVGRFVPKLLVRNLSLAGLILLFGFLIFKPIGNTAENPAPADTQTSADERPVLHCKWCKKVIIGEPYEDLYNYTIEPDGIGIIIFNSGTKYGYCSEECAKKGALAGYGYTKH